MMYHILHPGLTEYHHVGLIVPVLAALSPMVLTRLFKDIEIPHVAKALLYGVLVTAISYALLKFAPIVKVDELPLSKAVLLGTLVTEMTIFSSSEKIPSIVLLFLFLFLYFFSLSKIP